MLNDSQISKILNDNRAIFTLFAPIDEGFTKAGDGIDLSDLEAVRKVLLNHVIFATNLRSKDIDCESVIPPLKMANGRTVDVGCTESDISVFGDGFKSTVIEPDIQTCNGMIHVVDEVLLPPAGDIINTGGDGDCQTLGTSK